MEFIMTISVFEEREKKIKIEADSLAEAKRACTWGLVLDKYKPEDFFDEKIVSTRNGDIIDYEPAEEVNG